nr:hypothetical protein [Methanothermobacter thermautotrophicus]
MDRLTFKSRKRALKRIKRRSLSELAASWVQDDLLYSGRGRASS